MVFKRRDRRHWTTIVREYLYPRSGWRRAAHYTAHRIRRLPDTPHRIALGFSAGVFVSFTPLFGLHFVAAALVAMIVRGNILAALLGTFVGNPLTFPLIATASYRFGILLLGGHDEAHHIRGLKEAMWEGMTGLWASLKSLVGIGDAHWAEVGVFFTDVFVPYLVGGIIPGLVTAAFFYFLGRPLVAAYQVRRRARVEKKALKRKLKSAARPAE